MAFHTYFAPNVKNFAVFADEKSRPLNAHIFSAIHVFFHPNAIGFEHFLVGITQQCHTQIVFGFEFFVLFDTVCRNTDNLRIGGGKGVIFGCKFNRFGCASRRVVFGVEINYQLELKNKY